MWPDGLMVCTLREEATLVQESMYVFDSSKSWRVVLFIGRATRIRRRRAGSVDDTTDAIRAVACIRFVRLWFCEWHRKGFDLRVKLSRSLENEMAL
jgi:hypothetical protein